MKDLKDQIIEKQDAYIQYLKMMLRMETPANGSTPEIFESELKSLQSQPEVEQPSADLKTRFDKLMTSNEYENHVWYDLSLGWKGTPEELYNTMFKICYAQGKQVVMPSEELKSAILDHFNFETSKERETAYDLIDWVIQWISELNTVKK